MTPELAERNGKIEKRVIEIVLEKGSIMNETSKEMLLFLKISGEEKKKKERLKEREESTVNDKQTNKLKAKIQRPTVQKDKYAGNKASKEEERQKASKQERKKKRKKGKKKERKKERKKEKERRVQETKRK